MTAINVVLNTRQKSSHKFEVYDFDGNLDLVTAATPTSNAPAMATCAIDDSDNRLLWITGVASGSPQITLQVSPSTPSPQLYSVTVNNPPNLSHISGTVDNPPVAK